MYVFSICIYAYVTLINKDYYYYHFSETGEFCQNDVFKASCDLESEVIVMTSAQYGRMRKNTCIERDYGYLGCFEDVLQTADVMCSGRRSCTIPIPNQHLDQFRPCPNDLKSYLKTTYMCLPGKINYSIQRPGVTRYLRYLLLIIKIQVNRLLETWL